MKDPIIHLYKSQVSPAIPTIWLAQQAYIQVAALSAPYLQHELIINWGDTFKVNESSGQSGLIFNRLQLIASQVVAQGRYQAFGIIFHPAGVYHTYGLNVRELSDPTSADWWLFGKTQTLKQHLEESNSLQDQLEVLITFFKQNSLNRAVPKVVQDFLKVVSHRIYQPLEIKKIAQELKFSSKHLIATFKDIVGITPLKYIQLVQLNQALYSMKQFSNKKLTEIALEQGFYDQSHFIRLFKKCINMRPSQFRNWQSSQTHEFVNTIIY